MSNRKAMVIGGTGLIGGELLRQLIADPAYDRVLAPTRRPLGLNALSKLEEFQFDFSDWSGLEKRLPVDDVFCCLGTTIKKAGSQAAFRRVDFEYPLDLARLAEKSGCKRYLIVSSLGADATSSVFYTRVKGEIEQAVSELSGFEAVHVLRPSLLLGDRGEKRLGEEIATVASGLISWTLVGPARKYRPIQGARVATALINLAREERQGRFIHESDELERIAG